MKIAHISDLHITSTNFVQEWGNNLLRLLETHKPDICVITGDLTNDGYVHEYEVVKKYLDSIKTSEKIIVPGNHDARNSGYKIFEEMFTTRFPFYDHDNIVILGLDSTEPDIDDGHIGRENYQVIKKRLAGTNKIRIMALHHHLIPIPGTGRERNILVDAGEVLKICMDLKLNFVFSGHKHLPWVWKMGDTFFITAGTATSRRLKGRSYPSFNILNVTPDTCILQEINVSNKASRNIATIPPTIID